MRIAEITVQGVEATASIESKITAGMVGATVRIQYPDPYWAGLVKNITFKGADEVTLLNVGDTVTIPPQTVAKANVRLQVGIVGISADGTTQVTPTLWADLGVVKAAAPTDPKNSGDMPTTNVPFWSQLESMIGNLADLTTEEKSNLVAAINWMMDKGIGTPEIGENGNWFIGGEDTGIPARGPKGDRGESGVYVGPGEMPEGCNVQIDPEGELPEDLIPEEVIRDAVNAYLDENPPAQGEPGADGYTPVKGVDYFTPEDVQEIAQQAAGLVEVPKGGGNWATLCEHELAEEATVSLTFDYTKDEYMLVILVPKMTASLSSQASSFLGGQGLMYYTPLGNTAYPQMTVLHSIRLGDAMQFQLRATVNGPTVPNPMTMSAGGTAVSGMFFANRTTGLNIPASMPVGTKIYIYGR